jgi:hypothetical protein
MYAVFFDDLEIHPGFREHGVFMWQMKWTTAARAGKPRSQTAAFNKPTKRIKAVIIPGRMNR